VRGRYWNRALGAKKICSVLGATKCRTLCVAVSLQCVCTASQCAAVCSKCF